MLNHTASASAASLNLDDSDFTLNSSTTNDLMLMMMQHDQLNASTATTTSHKRKHSNEKLNTQFIQDDDSSSSWNSKLEASNNKSNATFHFSNKKISTLIGSNKKGLCFNRPDNNNLIKLIRSNNLAQANRRSSSSITKTKAVKQRKKNKINDLDYEDDNKFDEFDLKIDLDDNDYTDDLNEDASETATSENDNVFNNNIRNLNDDFYESDNSSDDHIDNNEDTTSDELDNKMKLNKRNQNRPFKDDWNSSEDTNERYCICKDISYGDMIMCDNSRVNNIIF